MEWDGIEEDDKLKECCPWVSRGVATAGGSEEEET